MHAADIRDYANMRGYEKLFMYANMRGFTCFE